MAVVAAVEAVALVAVVVILLRHFASQAKAWGEERRELLNRIQAPERIPVASAQVYEVPEREPDEWATVGTISIDPEYGLED
jgi:hypothetical protein